MLLLPAQLQEAFKRLGLSIMGTTSSKLEKSLPSSFPDSERLFGLENVSCAAAQAPPAPAKKEGSLLQHICCARPVVALDRCC